MPWPPAVWAKATGATRVRMLAVSTPDEPPVTGHPAVDNALADLDLSGPVEQHADEIQRVHQVLQEVLNPGDQPPGR